MGITLTAPIQSLQQASSNDIRSRRFIFQLFSAISKSQPSGIRPSKNGIEIMAFSLGWLLGGNLGIGTIATALGLGTSLAFILKFYDVDLKELKHKTIKEEIVSFKKKIKL